MTVAWGVLEIFARRLPAAWLSRVRKARLQTQRKDSCAGLGNLIFMAWVASPRLSCHHDDEKSYILTSFGRRGWPRHNVHFSYT